jgi:type I restriction enzyme, S subunit
MTLHSTSVSWPTVRLDDVANIQTGVAKGNKAKDGSIFISYLRVANVQDGFVDLSEIKEIEIDPVELDRYRLRPGDVLFTEGGDYDKLGRGTVWHGQVDPCLHQNHVFAVRVHEDKLLPEFLAYLASSAIGKKYFVSCSKQSTNLASINSTQLRHFPIPLPSLSEQRLIVDLLSTWDRGVEVAERLVSAAERRLQGLCQTSFRTHPDWPLVQLANLVRKIDRKADNLNHPVMTISAQSGFITQEERFGRSLAGRNLENYTLLQRGEFSYNKGNSLTYPQGCIFRLKNKSALIPNVYISFSLPNNVNHDFYTLLFAAGILNKQLAGHINFGVRNNGLLNINFDAFLSCKVPIPPLSEQTRLASVLGATKRVLDLYRTERDALRRQRRALTTDIFAGRLRVSDAARIPLAG